MECPPPNTSVALGFVMPADELRQRQARLHIAAHRVQDDEQPLHFRVFFNGNELWNDMLVLGGLLRLRRDGMSLDLPDDRQAMDGMPSLCAQHRACLQYIILFKACFVGFRLCFLAVLRLRFCFRIAVHGLPPFAFSLMFPCRAVFYRLSAQK